MGRSYIAVNWRDEEAEADRPESNEAVRSIEGRPREGCIGTVMAMLNDDVWGCEWKPQKVIGDAGCSLWSLARPRDGACDKFGLVTWDPGSNVQI